MGGCSLNSAELVGKPHCHSKHRAPVECLDHAEHSQPTVAQAKQALVDQCDIGDQVTHVVPFDPDLTYRIEDTFASVGGRRP